MNLFAKLLARKEAGTPVRVGLIGAGKFGSMFLAQARKLPAIHIAGIADLSPERARANLAFVDWKEETYHATHLDDACAQNTTFITDDASLLIADERINIIIEATGDPLIAVDHIIAALDAGKDVINVTVEADAFCGPVLARRAEAAGQIYSMAYGTSRHLCVTLLIGHAPVVFLLWQQGGGINGCPIIAYQHQKLFGTTGVLQKNKQNAAD
jgi:predicted homoserine dehydrogenase-like protein